jgi:rhamnulokinase
MNFLACDCGNSSIRVNLCRIENGKIGVENILSEENKNMLVAGYFYWDMLRIFDLLKKGIALAAQKERIHGVGICTWGIDFMLFDKKGTMLANVLCYRNPLGEEQLSRLSAKQQERMFFQTGILCNRINSVFMLKAMREKMPELLGIADKILLVPDILNYFFTGVMQNEPSELSSSQLMDTRTMQINKELCAEHGVNPGLFSTVGKHGALVGNILPHILKEMKIDYDIPVICVPSHDTASAVLGVPAMEEEFAYISAGTWALIGAECPKPKIEQKVFDAGMTNEVGAFGRITLLKNSMGMFILQRLKKEYDLEYGKTDWNTFTRLEDASSYSALLYNVNNLMFFNPENMSDSIRKYLADSGQIEGDITWPDIMLATHCSMAANYALAVEDASYAAGREYDRVYIVGGGAKNDRINSRFADMYGRMVLTCDKECASVGNAVAQLCYYEPALGLRDLKKIVAESLETKTYEPISNKKALLEKYKTLH